MSSFRLLISDDVVVNGSTKQVTAGYIMPGISNNHRLTNSSDCLHNICCKSRDLRQVVGDNVLAT